MNIKIEVDMSDLEFDIDKVESAIEKELAVTGYKIEGTAKELCPVDTGVLKGSITCKPNGLEVDVFTNVEYSVYMEYGTSPHVIMGYPFLYWEGASHPVDYVIHPGTKAYLYMTTAFDSHTEDLDVRIANIIEDVL